MQSLRHVDFNSSIVVSAHLHLEANIVRIQVVILGKDNCPSTFKELCLENHEQISCSGVSTFNTEQPPLERSFQMLQCDGVSYVRGRICHRIPTLACGVVVPMIQFQSTDCGMAKEHSGPWWNVIKIPTSIILKLFRLGFVFPYCTRNNQPRVHLLISGS